MRIRLRGLEKKNNVIFVCIKTSKQGFHHDENPVGLPSKMKIPIYYNGKMKEEANNGTRFVFDFQPSLI